MRKINKYKFSEITTINLVIVVTMLLFSLPIVSQTGAGVLETPKVIARLETLGPFESGHMYQLHIYNIDDVSQANINGHIIGPYSGVGTSEIIDITQYLTQANDNTIILSTTNNFGGWAYGFEILKDHATIWTDRCGLVDENIGCMGSDQTLGLVYRSILVLPSQAPLFSFVRGGDNGLWYKTYDGNSWSGWVSLGGFLTSDPDSAKLNGDTYVFVRGGDNALWYQKYNSGAKSWSGWQNLGGTTTSGPGAS